MPLIDGDPALDRCQEPRLDQPSLLLGLRNGTPAGAPGCRTRRRPHSHRPCPAPPETRGLRGGRQHPERTRRQGEGDQDRGQVASQHPPPGPRPALGALTPGGGDPPVDLVDHLPVAEVHLPIAPGSDLRIVRRDQHRRPGSFPDLQTTDPSPIRAFAESRFPVGSSASSSTGSPTNARAIATRCCWPPDSWPGNADARSARPTRSRSSEGPAADLTTPGVGQQRQLHVLQPPSAPPPGERPGTRTPPDAGARPAPARAKLDTSAPRTVNDPDVARSRPPSRCSRVDLPNPEAPITATVHGSSTVNDNPRRARRRGVAGSVDLAHALDRQFHAFHPDPPPTRPQ